MVLSYMILILAILERGNSGVSPLWIMQEACRYNNIISEIIPSLGIPSSILFAMNLAQHGVQQPFSFTIIPALCICNIHKWKEHSLSLMHAIYTPRIASISSDLTSICAWSCVYMCHPCNWEKRAQLSSWQRKKVAL